MTGKWFFGLLTVLASCIFSYGQEDNPKKDSILLCDISVPEIIQRANATFGVIYKLDLDTKGTPAQITMVENPFLEDKQFRECLKEWILPAPNRGVTVIFYWKHGVGWQKITILGLDPHREIILRKP